MYRKILHVCPTICRYVYCKQDELYNIFHPLERQKTLILLKMAIKYNLIEKFSALSEADIRGVIIALENVIQENLNNGRIIRMDKLGSFYPGLSSNGAATKDEFNSSFIKEAYVNYRPGKRIIDALKAATFKKADWL